MGGFEIDRYIIGYHLIGRTLLPLLTSLAPIDGGDSVVNVFIIRHGSAGVSCILKAIRVLSEDKIYITITELRDRSTKLNFEF